MRALLVSVLITLSFILTACGGGGGSDSGPDVRVSLGLNFDKSRASADGFYVSNTKIESVTLSYTNNAGSSGSKNVTAQASDGMVELNGLALNSTYTFTILAMTEGDVQACTGSTSVLIAEGQENTATIECVFPDSLAVGNAVFDFVEVLMSGNPTAENIDEYVANDFGVYDGYDRTEFIADLLDDPGFAFTDPSVRLESVEVITGVARAVGTESFIKFHFSDGSVAQEYVGLVKEDDKWKLAGNGKRFEADITTQAYYIIPHLATPNSLFYSGVSTEFYDPGNVLSSIDVSAVPMSETYSFVRASCADCDGFNIDYPHINDIPYFFSNHYINLFAGGTNSDVAADQKYTLKSYYSDTTEEEFTLTAYGKPVQTDTLNTSYFATVPATTSQNIAEYIANTNYTFTLIKPTAYDAQLIEVNLEYTDYNGNHGEIEGMIPLTAKTFTVDFSYLAGHFITDASVFISAYDSEGRVFTTVIELYYDAANVTLSSSGYTALADAISKMTASQMTAFSGLMVFSYDANVRTLFTEISDASSAGLTPDDVSNAYATSLTRAGQIGNPYTSGTPEYTAFENLVDGFYNLLSSNSEAALSIATFVLDLSNDGFQALGTLLGIADDEGFETYAQVLSSSLEEIIAEVEAQTGETVTSYDGYEVEDGLNYVQLTDGNSYYSMRGISGFLSENGAVICSSGNSGTATLYVEGGSEKGDIYHIVNTTDNIQECYSINEITDEASNYHGYSYAVFSVFTDTNTYTFVIMFDSELNIAWAKKYTSISDLLIKDAELAGENLILLMAGPGDDYTGHLYEIKPDGTTGTSTAFKIEDPQGGAVRADYNDLLMGNGQFVLVGSGTLDGGDYAGGLIVQGTYTTAATTNLVINGGYVSNIYSSTFGDLNTTFLSGALNGNDLMLIGYGNDMTTNNLVVSKFDIAGGYFYHAVSLSESYVSDAVNITTVDTLGGTGNYAMVSAGSIVENLEYHFDENNDFQIDNSSTFDYTNNLFSLYISDLISDEEGHLFFTGNLTEEYSVNLLLGAMNTDDLSINGVVDIGGLELSSFEETGAQLPDIIVHPTTVSSLGITVTDETSNTSLSLYSEENSLMNIIVNMLM